VPTRHFDTARGVLEWLKQAEEYRDWTIIGMETTANSVEYTQIDYAPIGCVLVFGNEVTGIDPELLQDPEMIICQIPMFGAKNSLNVAACAPGKILLCSCLTTVCKPCTNPGMIRFLPVVLYEIIRQWSRPSSDSG
jgi:tRNA G18 (ribose-2'-O)-methylase SpoU